MFIQQLVQVLLPHLIFSRMKCCKANWKKKKKTCKKKKHSRISITECNGKGGDKKQAMKAEGERTGWRRRRDDTGVKRTMRQQKKDDKGGLHTGLTNGLTKLTRQLYTKTTERKIEWNKLRVSGSERSLMFDFYSKFIFYIQPNPTFYFCSYLLLYLSSFKSLWKVEQKKKKKFQEKEKEHKKVTQQIKNY